MHAAGILAGLAYGAAAASVTWKGSCSTVTPLTWGQQDCWVPSPPVDADTVVFPGSVGTVEMTGYTNTTEGNGSYAVQAFVLGGLVVENNATVVLGDGVIVLKANATIKGTLIVRSPFGSPPQYANTSVITNPEVMVDDPMSQEIGLRQCSYMPQGFTPRLCGPGAVVVEDGGEVKLDWIYASVFAHVHVKTGGALNAGSNTFLWGMLTNEGTVNASDPPLYFHGVLDNKRGGKAEINGIYDLYSHNETTPRIENVSSYVFINEGTLSLDMMLTNYYYPWFNNATGTYEPTLLNLPGGVVTHLQGPFTYVENNGNMSVQGLKVPQLVSKTGYVTVASVPVSQFDTINNSGSLQGSLHVSNYLYNLEGGSMSDCDLSVNYLVNHGNMQSITGGAHHLVNFGSIMAVDYAAPVKPRQNQKNQGTMSNKASGTISNSTLKGFIACLNEGLIQYSTLMPHNIAGWPPGTTTVTNSGRADNVDIDWRFGGPYNGDLKVNNSGYHTGYMGGYDSTYLNDGYAELNLAGRSGSTTLRNNGNITIGAFSGGSDLINTGRVYIKGNTRWNYFESNRTVYVDGVTLWVTYQLDCQGCYFYLLNNAEVHIAAVAQTPRSFVRGTSNKPWGTPDVCSTGGCVPDPCRYAAGFQGATACVTSDGIHGVVPYASMADDECSFYACSPAHPLGLLNDVRALAELANKAHPSNTESAAEEHSNQFVYHFEGGVVSGDGTGAVVVAAPLHLTGHKALRVKAGCLSSVLEEARPVVVGGGELWFERGTTARLGLAATLEDGGTLRVRPGSKLVVEPWAHVRARNHTLRMERGSVLQVDGTLHLERSTTMQACARAVGTGKVVLDDPSSAVPCSSSGEGVCGAKCSADTECSGLCSQCGGGLCVEPSCTPSNQTLDADCNYNGKCEAGVCATCDKQTIPTNGIDCSKIARPRGVSSFSFYNDVTVRSPTYFFTQHYMWISTLRPEGCPFGTARDYLAVSESYVDPNHGRAFLRYLLQHSSRNPFVHRNSNLYFDYAYPPIDPGCHWKYGVCQGNCSSGAPCAMNSINSCGCTDCPKPQPPPPGFCSSYIAVVTEETVGDCEPGSVYNSSCFCKRDGTQHVVGTKGCPSYPVVIDDPHSENTVLMFYNMGDGSSVGLASGPPQGPWTVVKEPVLTGYQNAYPYLVNKIGNSTYVMHAYADKLHADGTTSIRHIATPDKGSTWVYGTQDVLSAAHNYGWVNRSHPRLLNVPTPPQLGCGDLYTEGYKGTSQNKQQTRQRLC
eukprot:Hpha_TRINITY_DN4433_c0_g1::TRINITY_DN4433_c0_g1_i1::g.50517::m.50517